MDEEHRSLNDDLFDAAIKEALRKLSRERELEAEQLLDSLREEARQIVPSRKFQNNMKYLCARAGKRKAPARIYPRALRMAAAVALVACVSATAVTVGVNADWDSLLGWSMKQTPVATHLEREIDPEDLCSEQIFGSADAHYDYYYFPQYIPKNYEITKVEADELDITTSFVNSMDPEKRFNFDLMPIPEDPQFSPSFTIDTEDTKGLQKIVLGQYECYYVAKSHKDPDTNAKIDIVQVLCNHGDFWIWLHARNMPKKEMFKVMESVVKIEKK